MIKKILIFLYCFCILPVFSLSIPALVTPVTDEAGIMTNSEKDALNQYLIQLNETTGIQMAVLTIPSLEGQAIESYSIEVVDAWQLGTAAEDKGALLLVALAEKAIRLEIGYGLEAVLTDAQSGLIIRQIIAPYFQTGNFSAGITAGIQAMAQTALGDIPDDMLTLQAAEQQEADEQSSGIVTSILALIIFLVAMLIAMNTRGRGSSNVADAIITIGLLSTLGRGGRSHGRGGFGGGGFGGFSGGGGGFGGGGASGGW